MQDSKNLILAIALSVIVLVGWQYFFGMPLLEGPKKPTEIASQLPNQPAAPNGQGATAPSAAAPSVFASREEALAASPRIIIDTAKLKGSIALKGGDIDDISFKAYRETVDPNSPNITLFSPDKTQNAYFARFFWLAAQGSTIELPSVATLWSADSDKLTADKPVTLSWDNGQGFLFKRVIAVDDLYMFTITDSVEATGSGNATLVPYSVIRRFNKPHVAGTYVLHEGFVGVLGDQGLAELTYDKADKGDALAGGGKGKEYKAAIGGFTGITDKYWAAAFVPDQTQSFDATYRAVDGATKIYEADMMPVSYTHLRAHET